MMKTAAKSLALCVSLLPLLGVADEVQLKAEHVALFKNGYSQVSLSGKLPDGASLELRGMPVPVEGSVWWQLPQGIRVVQVDGFVSERSVPSPMATVDKLLSANVGKEVVLGMKDGSSFEGVLVQKVSSAPLKFTYTNRDQVFEYQSPIFLRVGDRHISIHLAELVSVQFKGEPNVPTSMEQHYELAMLLSKPAPGAELKLECLAGGLSWSPSYRIDLRDDGKADLQCKATIINDMVDLENVQLELVTGQPNMGDSSLPVSPLLRFDLDKPGLGTGISLSGRGLGAGLGAGGRAPTATPSVCADDDEDDDAFAEAPTWLCDTEMSRAEDLFYFSIPDFSAKKNSTAVREILFQTPEYKHVYKCEIGSYSRSSFSVWHGIVLKNESSSPWSPGSVVCYSGDRLLTRAEVEFTAAGQELFIRLAESSDVKVEAKEKIVSKQSSAEEADEDDSDAFRKKSEKTVTFAGSISLTNNTDHEVNFDLSKSIQGIVSAASDDAVISASPGYRSKNPDSDIRWKLLLKPKETKTCTYTYSFKVK